MALWFVAGSSAFCALASGLLVYFVMQSRLEVLIARQRESLAEAQAGMEAQKQSLAGILKSVEETTKRTAFDGFLADIRIEERHYLREQKMLFVSRKSMVVRERIFFRNIPLSGWVEHEVPYEEGADIDQLARSVAVFSPDLMMDGRNRNSGQQISHKNPYLALE
jgi:hypothetical protein